MVKRHARLSMLGAIFLQAQLNCLPHLSCGFTSLILTAETIAEQMKSRDFPKWCHRRFGRKAPQDIIDNSLCICETLVPEVFS